MNCERMLRKVWSGKTGGLSQSRGFLLNVILQVADNIRRHSIGSHMCDVIVHNLSDVRGLLIHQIVYGFCHLCIYCQSVQLFYTQQKLYRHLVKERPWVEHLTSLPKRGVGAMLSVSHLSTKVRPWHVYSNSRPSNQITGQTITSNRTSIRLLHDGPQHSEGHHIIVSMV